MKEKLQKLLENSYAPYSKMKFACIVETKNGNFYEGVNVENASFGGSICAERNAINNAISHGEKEFNALYLMSNSDEIFYPCHICKQTFTEFFNDKVIFNIMNSKGDMKVFNYREMMNTTFDKDDVL